MNLCCRQGCLLTVANPEINPHYHVEKQQAYLETEIKIIFTNKIKQKNLNKGRKKRRTHKSLTSREPQSKTEESAQTNTEESEDDGEVKRTRLKQRK